MVAPPRSQCLYNDDFEHDACGVAFVVDMHGRRTHGMVQMGLDSLCHFEHRGASGTEVNTGDGAGILLQVPDRFYRATVDFDLPGPGRYATGIGFLPTDEAAAVTVRSAIAALAASEGLTVVGWRSVPTDDSMIGDIARGAMPAFHQLFVAGAEGAPLEGLPLERRAFVLRK